MKNPIVKKLNNGLTVIYNYKRSKGTVLVKLSGLAGNHLDNIETAGTAHFLEHMLFKGSKNYKTSKELSAFIEDLAGYSNASTGRNTVEFYAEGLKEDANEIFKYLSEVTLEPVFKKTEIEKEKNIILQELKTKKSTPKAIFYSTLFKKIYKSNKLFWLPVLGDEKTVMKINEKTLTNFYTKNYHTGNFVLGIASSLKPDKVFELSEKYFGNMKKGTKPKINKVGEIFLGKVYAGSHETQPNARISIEFKTDIDSNDNMKFAALSLCDVLDYGMSSRLKNKIREEAGLAYEISTDIGFDQGSMCGALEVFAVLDEKNIALYFALLKSEITKIKEELITDREFKKCRRLLKRYYVRNNENTEANLNNNLTQHLFFDKIKNFDERFEEMKRVTTKENIRQVAKKIFNNEYRIVCYSNSLTEKDIEKMWKS